MPVKHIVLMKFKADTPTEALDKATANLLALKGTGPPACANAKSLMREAGSAVGRE